MIYPDYYLLTIPILIGVIFLSNLMKNWRVFLLFCLLACGMWLITFGALYYCFPPLSGNHWIKPNEFGDMFGCLSCLFTGFGCAGLIMTLSQQNVIVKTAKEEKVLSFFYKTIELYIDACSKSNVPINGFPFTTIPKEFKNTYHFIPTNEHDATCYHAIRIEASLFLTALQYIQDTTEEHLKQTMSRILIPLLTVSKQRNYFAYLHITRNFPDLRKNKNKLLQEGYLATDPHRSPEFIEKWGELLYLELSNMNKTTNI